MQPAAASPLELTVRVVGKKWKPTILRLLAHTSRRFNQLHASIPGIAHKVLIEQLRELEQDGVFTEIHASKTRFFVPAGARAAEVLQRVTAYRPVVDLTPAGSTSP